MSKLTPTSNFTERFFDLFDRRPFAVFFRIFIIVYAIERQEYIYVVLFLIAVSIWVIESIALYVDPELYKGKLIGLANLLFYVLAFALAVSHIAPLVAHDALLITGNK